MTQRILPGDFVADTQVSKPAVRVIGGHPRTAKQSDTAELVHSLSIRVLVLASRELRKIEKSSTAASVGRQELLIDVISSTQRLRTNPTLNRTPAALPQLRQYLAKLITA